MLAYTAELHMTMEYGVWTQSNKINNYFFIFLITEYCLKYVRKKK